MKWWFNKIEQLTSQFTVIDVGILKLCLITIGIILGTIFQPFFSDILWIIWALFIISWLYIIIKIFAVYWHKTTHKEENE